MDEREQNQIKKPLNASPIGVRLGPVSLLLASFIPLATPLAMVFAGEYIKTQRVLCRNDLARPWLRCLPMA